LTDPKSAGAFRTIGELSKDIGLPQHILRYWETRFPQLRPVTRAGNRRYYRPEDVALVKQIDQALNRDGYTIKGVQKLLASPNGSAPVTQTVAAQQNHAVAVDILDDLLKVRNALRLALSEADD
jgi:DNA-binding transcriptional MerR regulator